MHIAPVVLIPHAGGPPGWLEDLETLSDCISRHPGLPVTVRIPGAALEHAIRKEPQLWRTLERESVLWLAGGYTDPVLTSLPPTAAVLQLERETVAMDAAGVTPGGLWAGNAWEPGLISLARGAALPLVFLDASLFDRLPERPGPVDRAGEAVIAIPVMASVPDSGPADSLAAVRIPASRLDDLVEGHAGRLVTPDGYLIDHPPGDRLAPPVASPDRHRERETFYRKLLVLTRDHADRSSGRDAVLRLQSREHLLEADSLEADGKLIESRVALDRARHRGDSWVEVRNVDWDADGMPEVWIETPDYTLVIDPPAGSFDVWDDKSLGWPITAVVPALAGVIRRRLGDDGREAPAPRMAVEGRTEGKSHASVTMVDALAGSCRLEVAGRTITIEMAVAPTEPVRLGPEIPLNLEGARLRADGGSWVEAAQPVAVSGHRFRITDGARTMLVAAPRPCELFVRPLSGRGVVIWPHWMTRGGASYRLALTPS
jgi:hypothetical protein